MKPIEQTQEDFQKDWEEYKNRFFPFDEVGEADRSDPRYQAWERLLEIESDPILVQILEAMWLKGGSSALENIWTGEAKQATEAEKYG